MSINRDERRAIRDERRAAIKAAVAIANAITKPVVFRDRSEVAERRQYSDGYGQLQSTRSILARSDDRDTVRK
jgi:hypothetical protein